MTGVTWIKNCCGGEIRLSFPRPKRPASSACTRNMADPTSNGLRENRRWPSSFREGVSSNKEGLPAICVTCIDTIWHGLCSGKLHMVSVRLPMLTTPSRWSYRRLPCFSDAPNFFTCSVLLESYTTGTLKTRIYAGPLSPSARWVVKAPLAEASLVAAVVHLRSNVRFETKFPTWSTRGILLR